MRKSLIFSNNNTHFIFTGKKDATTKAIKKEIEPEGKSLLF